MAKQRVLFLLLALASPLLAAAQQDAASGECLLPQEILDRINFSAVREPCGELGPGSQSQAGLGPLRGQAKASAQGGAQARLSAHRFSPSRCQHPVLQAARCSSWGSVPWGPVARSTMHHAVPKLPWPEPTSPADVPQGATAISCPNCLCALSATMYQQLSAVSASWGSCVPRNARSTHALYAYGNLLSDYLHSMMMSATHGEREGRRHSRAHMPQSTPHVCPMLGPCPEL